ncbi:MAG: PAS domain S-box protein [Deltaproteobacteria bacterium]|nr:PAS domain S-box protein [Deltaproteobacteria bacterium]
MQIANDIGAIEWSNVLGLLAMAVVICVASYGYYNHFNRRINAEKTLRELAGQNLRDKQQQLEEFNSTLEMKVEERTAELLQDRDNLNRILDAMHNGVYIVNQERRIVYANPALILEFGPVDGRSCHEYLHGLQGSCDWCNNREVFSGQTVYREWTSNRNGKTYSTFDTPYKNAGGEICKLAILHDISAQKIAEKTIKDYNEELEQRVTKRTRALENANYELTAINEELEQRRSEAEEAHKELQLVSKKYRLLFDNANDGIFIHDTQARILAANPMVLERLGYSHVELLSILVSQVDSPDQCQHVQERMARLMEQGHLTFETVHQRKNGSLIPTEVSARLIQWGGQPAVMSICRDITDRKRAEEELMAARDAANVASLAKSEFLSNMSHEIRTPLSAIIGFSDLTLKTNLPLRQHDYVLKIQSAGELLLNIVNDILDFSKMEAGHLKMELIPFRLDTILANVINTVQQSAQAKCLRLQVETIPEAVSYLIGDPHRLGQIFINLLNNAVKFTKQGEIVFRAELLKQEIDRLYLKFSILDTGIGLAAEQIDKLFHAFTQADSSTTRQFGGTGLGLSISKQLVELMGGKIWCESTPGQGSLFSFTAWFGICHTSDIPHAVGDNVNEEAVKQSFDFSGSRILLVEDNVMNRQLAIELLKDTGAVVDIAVNGEEAVTMVTGGGTLYDLVLMDIQMPIMDGYRATRFIRADGRFARLPIIAMTAHAMQGERQKISEAGIDAYIAKPIDAGDMLQVIKFFLHEEDSSIQLNKLIVGNTGKEPEIPDIVGLDILGALDRLDGNRKLYLWLLRTFVDKESNTPAMIKEALRGGDTKLAGRHIHTVKSSAGSIGAVELEVLARTLEAAILSDEPPTGVSNVVERFTEEFTRLMEELICHLPVVPQTNNNLNSTLDVAVVTPIFGRLLEYINSMDGNAEHFLDDYHEELAGLPVLDIGQIKSYLNKFDYVTARDALLALSARNGIILSSAGGEDCEL